MEWGQSNNGIKGADNNNSLRILLDTSFQGVKRLFILAFDDTDNGANKVERNRFRKYFLPRVDIINYNALIDDRIFSWSPYLLEIK